MISSILITRQCILSLRYWLINDAANLGVYKLHRWSKTYTYINFADNVFNSIQDTVCKMSTRMSRYCCTALLELISVIWKMPLWSHDSHQPPLGKVFIKIQSLVFQKLRVTFEWTDRGSNPQFLSLDFTVADNHKVALISFHVFGLLHDCWD